jgi:inner membrane transporter RhtA
MLLLHEQLTGTQWLAIACIMGAAMGSAITRPAAAAKAPVEATPAG